MTLLAGAVLALLGAAPEPAITLADRVAQAMLSTVSIWICVGPDQAACDKGQQFPGAQWLKAGSGVKVQPRLVATAGHVLLADVPTLAVAVVPDIGNSPPTPYKAMVASLDEAHDLAVLSVPDLPGPSISLGRGTDLRPGTEVFFLGHPFAMTGPVVGVGILSSLESRWSIDGKERLFYGLDASINQGNSGGAVFLREDGHLIGIVNAKAGSLSQRLTAFRDAKLDGGIRVSGLDPVAALQQTLREMQANLHLGLGAFAGVQHLRTLLDRTKPVAAR